MAKTSAVRLQTYQTHPRRVPMDLARHGRVLVQILWLPACAYWSRVAAEDDSKWCAFAAACGSG